MRPTQTTLKGSTNANVSFFYKKKRGGGGGGGAEITIKLKLNGLKVGTNMRRRFANVGCDSLRQPRHAERALCKIRIKKMAKSPHMAEA